MAKILWRIAAHTSLFLQLADGASHDVASACALSQVVRTEYYYPEPSPDSSSNPPNPHGYPHESVPGGGVKPKNFVFIMADDQDLHLDSLSYMENVQKHIADEGTWFKNHYCTVSQCCPSRISLWTGKAAHNTNVTDVVLPYGGYQQFARNGLNDNYLPVWLQEAGYNTYYVGKLINDHSIETYNKPYAKGWTGSDFLIGPGIYNYYNATMVRNHDEPKFYPGQYSTDVVAEKGLGFLEDAIGAEKPFFLAIAPIGPHTQALEADGKGPPNWTSPVPAKRHEHLFPDLQIPRNDKFNAARIGGVSYYKNRTALTDTEIEAMDAMYRDRIRCLQAVDELVGRVMDRLHASLEILENTYVIYTSDNGFHMGQFRLAPGKICNIEEDINIPFMMRGPGVGKNEVQEMPTSHTDVIPTLLKLAGIEQRPDFDGYPMPVTPELANADLRAKSEHVNVEFWGEAIVGELPIFKPSGHNNTYKTLRLLSPTYSLSYTVWCTNEHELYDMRTDPSQLINIYGTDCTINSWPCEKLTARLDALLLTTKACKGRQCYEPWSTLHPDGSVRNLGDAMDERFDEFYAQQPRVSFEVCQKGYLPEFEGAMGPVPWGSGEFGM